MNVDHGLLILRHKIRILFRVCIAETFISLYPVIFFQLAKNKKYAKWKAAYIHKCLKNGETPVSGPLGEDDEELEGEASFHNYHLTLY